MNGYTTEGDHFDLQVFLSRLVGALTLRKDFALRRQQILFLKSYPFRSGFEQILLC